MINTNLLPKATKIKIIPTRKSKNNVQHYAITFYGIPFMDKNHRTYYSEIIFHDCTFTHRNAYLLFTHDDICKYNIEINKKEIIINNAQSFLYDTQFTFEYHEEPSTTKLFTIQYQEYPEEV